MNNETEEPNEPPMLEILFKPVGELVMACIPSLGISSIGVNEQEAEIGVRKALESHNLNPGVDP
jgi:hypothetical protein